MIEIGSVSVNYCCLIVYAANSPINHYPKSWRYKNFKYYIEDQDSTVYLDCINQSLDANFDPGLVYVLTSHIVEYIYSNIETITSVFKVERLPSPEHNHG